jgi:hypothetical protein
MTRDIIALLVGLCGWILACYPAFAATQMQVESPATNFESAPSLYLQSGPSPKIWERGIGDGFACTAQSLSVGLGVNIGMETLGGEEAHHLAMLSLSYGHILTPVLGENAWYRGNLEFRLEFFGGSEFSPSTAWFVGLTPELRYAFATGTHWVPFVEAGAGVTATQIGPPDLSGTFEFNLLFGTGVEYFVKDNLALTMEARYTHWSCGGISEPNLGLNGVTVLFGVAVFF